MSERGLAASLLALAVAAMAFEGGASPNGILLVHGLLAGLGIAVLVSPRPSAIGLPEAGRFGLAAFASGVLFSAWRAPYGFAALLVVQDVGLGLAVLWLAARAPQVASVPARLVLAAAAACQAGIALVQALPGGARPAGSFLNPNHLAAWTTAAGIAALPPLLALGGRWRAGGLALGGAVALAFVTTRSRGAGLGLIGGTAALVVLRWASLSGRAKRGALAAALAAALLAAFLFAYRQRESDPYRWTRTRIWAATLAIVRASPWVGCGPGQFDTAAARLRFQDPVGPLHWERRFSTPHSDVLRLPAEFGLPAALAAAFALGSLLRSAVRRSRAPDGLGSAASLAGFGALAVQAAVDDLTTRPALVVLGALLLGSVSATAQDRRPDATTPRRWPRLALASLVAVAFVMGDVAPWLAWRQLAGVPRGREDEVRLARALVFNPVHPDMHLRVAERRLRLGLRSPRDYARARDEAEEAVRLSPRDARYRLGLARVEALACHALFPDEATRARARSHYAAAARMAPFDPLVPLEEAAFLLSTGDAAGGERAARRALALEPAALPPRLTLARAMLARGEPAKARSLLAEAEALARRYASLPKDSPYTRRMLSADARGLAELRQALP